MNKMNREERYAHVLVMRERISRLSQKKEKPKKSRPSDEFHRSAEWRDLRRRVLEEYGPACMRCGSTGSPQVDHIRPKSLFPDARLDFENLQVLCWPCNRSKWSRKDETDYRPMKSIPLFLGDAKNAGLYKGGRDGRNQAKAGIGL